MAFLAKLISDSFSLQASQWLGYLLLCLLIKGSLSSTCILFSCKFLEGERCLESYYGLSDLLYSRKYYFNFDKECSFYFLRYSLQNSQNYPPFIYLFGLLWQVQQWTWLGYLLSTMYFTSPTVWYLSAKFS